MIEYLKIFCPQDEIEIKKQQIVSKRILHNSQMNYSLFSFDTDESVSEQSNSENIFIYVLDGEISATAKTLFTAKKGEVLGILNGTLHRVFSNMPSKLIQINTKVNEGDNTMTEFIKKINAKEVIKLNDAVDYEPGGVASKSLVQRESFTLTILAFDKGANIASHSSTGDALVQILEGKAQIQVGEEIFTLNAGESILMPAREPHALTALENFKMLLTVAKPE